MQMAEKILRYEGDSILVTYDLGRCLHAAECVRGLPEVFDPDSKPWVDPDGADADRVAEVIHRCPTGALQYRRKDDGAEEKPPAENTVTIAGDGPLYLHGEIEVVNADGETVIRDTRVALCRCGLSENKPFCDNRHEKDGFTAAAEIPDPKIRQTDTAATHLRVTAAKNGPLILDGPVELRGDGDGDRCHGTKTALCRCGESTNKPFCDGTHSRVGFSAP
jgi:CDGSH-type Zn-finger protein/uncharacterized Fe-S cluster protein YjdI